jgi:predicted peroxiredoxin
LLVVKMMHTGNTLGIIVNSNRYFDFVAQLAEAAVDQDKDVLIHLLGDGCEFVTTEACTRLSLQARITMCAKSAHTVAQKIGGRVKNRVTLVPQQGLTRLLEQSDRHVVF